MDRASVRARVRCGYRSARARRRGPPHPRQGRRQPGAMAAARKEDQSHACDLRAWRRGHDLAWRLARGGDTEESLDSVQRESYLCEYTVNVDVIIAMPRNREKICSPATSKDFVTKTEGYLSSMITKESNIKTNNLVKEI